MLFPHSLRRCSAEFFLLVYQHFPCVLNAPGFFVGHYWAMDFQLSSTAKVPRILLSRVTCRILEMRTSHLFRPVSGSCGNPLSGVSGPARSPHRGHRPWPSFHCDACRSSHFQEDHNELHTGSLRHRFPGPPHPSPPVPYIHHR